VLRVQLWHTYIYVYIYIYVHIYIYIYIHWNVAQETYKLWLRALERAFENVTSNEIDYRSVYTIRKAVSYSKCISHSNIGTIIINVHHILCHISSACHIQRALIMAINVHHMTIWLSIFKKSQNICLNLQLHPNQAILVNVLRFDIIMTWFYAIWMTTLANPARN